MRRSLTVLVLVFLLFVPAFAAPIDCYSNCLERVNDCAFGCWAGGAPEPDWGCFIECERLLCACAARCDGVVPVCLE